MSSGPNEELERHQDDRSRGDFSLEGLLAVPFVQRLHVVTGYTTHGVAVEPEEEQPEDA